MSERKVKIQLNSKNGSITFAVFMAGYILVALLGQLIVGAIFGEQSSAYRIICACFSSLTIVAVILFFIIYGKQGLTAITSTQNSGGIYLLVAPLLACGMFLGLGFVNEGLARAFVKWGLNASGIQINMPSIWHFIAYTITLAILPAVFEEALFRGIILNCFSGMKRLASVLLSAFIFALYHQNFAQFLYQFIYGVALGYLAILAKSIFPCMLAHFLNNFTVILLTYLNVSIDLFMPIVIVVGINALAFFGAIVFFAERRAQENQVVEGEVKRFFIPFGLFATLVCLAVAVSNLVA